LNADNDRYSFACAWGDSTNDGLPDLFVVNDFGSSQLYHNNGDSTFKVVSREANVESVGAGMSCSWCDYDNDGHQDVYVPSMWEAAGQRVSGQAQFISQRLPTSGSCTSATPGETRSIATRETDDSKRRARRRASKWPMVLVV